MIRYKCEMCGNDGYIHTTNEQGQDEVQRCDECAVYESDAEAQQAEALISSIKKAIDLIEIGENPEAYRILSEAIKNEC